MSIIARPYTSSAQDPAKVAAALTDIGYPVLAKRDMLVIEQQEADPYLSATLRLAGYREEA